MAKEKKKHPLLKGLLGTAAAGTAAYAAASYYAFRGIFDQNHTLLKVNMENITAGRQRYAEWFALTGHDELFTEAYDGLKLHALLLRQYPEDHRWFVPVHGYLSSSLDMLGYIYEAHRRGYNVLAPDLRACGLSEGKYTGLGWPEHYDLVTWISKIIQIDPQAEIMLLGASLGGTVVMNTIGDYLPANVKCAVDDSGFSDLREVLLYHIEKLTGLNGEYIMPGLDLLVRQNLHYAMQEVSTKRQLKQSRIPLMIIHGENDTIVPVRMGYDCYYATNAPKELWVVPECGHVQASGQPEYFEKIFAFADRHMDTVKTAEAEALKAE